MSTDLTDQDDDLPAYYADIIKQARSTAVHMEDIDEGVIEAWAGGKFTTNDLLVLADLAARAVSDEVSIETRVRKQVAADIELARIDIDNAAHPTTRAARIARGEV